MKRNESTRPRARVVAVALGVLLVSATGAGAAEPRGGPAEGIKVHGHWTIDVRNPDGTLASHQEVENALTSGHSVIAALLGRLFTGPRWQITLSGPPDPCPSGCQIAEDSSGDSMNLTVSVPGGVSEPAGTVELSGSVTAVGDGLISRVDSEVYLSTPTFDRLFPFTGRDVSIPVRQGQIIQVKVVFSFS